MSAAVAEIVVALVTAYVGAGAIFTAAFVTWGVGRVDHRAADAGWGFRVLIVPGSTLLWPMMLARWIRSGREKRP